MKITLPSLQALARVSVTGFAHYDGRLPAFGPRKANAPSALEVQFTGLDCYLHFWGHATISSAEATRRILELQEEATNDQS